MKRAALLLPLGSLSILDCSPEHLEKPLSEGRLVSDHGIALDPLMPDPDSSENSLQIFFAGIFDLLADLLRLDLSELLQDALELLGSLWMLLVPLVSLLDFLVQKREDLAPTGALFCLFAHDYKLIRNLL